MFWRDGYEAMSALDDNHDGWLTGRELTGLGVWRDANGNGKSDPGEVVPVGRMGIVRLAVHPQGKREGAFLHENGVVLKSGKSLPTYDWTPKSEAVIVVRGNSVFTLKKGRRSDRVYGRLSSVSSGQISDRKLVGH